MHASAHWAFEADWNMSTPMLAKDLCFFFIAGSMIIVTRLAGKYTFMYTVEPAANRRCEMADKKIYAWGLVA